MAESEQGQRDPLGQETVSNYVFFFQFDSLIYRVM